MRTPCIKRILAGATSLVIGMAAYPALADSHDVDAGAAVSNQELDTMRGGYDLGSGVLIPFGIDIRRDVFIDGVRVATSTLNIPIGGAPGQQSSGQGNATSPLVIQSGTGNSVSPDVLKNLGQGLFTFIQNSLDNKVIQNVTQINATLNSLSVYRQMNLSFSLNQQLIHSIR